MTSEFDNIAKQFSNIQNDWLESCKILDPKATIICDDLNKPRHRNYIRAISNGDIFEKAAIHFSELEGQQLPPAATEQFPKYHQCPFRVTGVSLIIHPLNPHAPTVHANFRYFSVFSETEPNLWWFGGGTDLTPHFIYEQDAYRWHLELKKVCEAYEPNAYERFKAWCDSYFYLPHRQETRGIGGVFFDYLNQHSREQTLAFCQQTARTARQCYLKILTNRQATPYTASDVEFQHLRRGRYVEFNLLHDRGTRFGLQYGSRTESVLNSMPPHARWSYGAQHPEFTRLNRYLIKDYPWLAPAKSESTDT